MQGYGIQQNKPSDLLEYYYDATNGTIIWSHSNSSRKQVDVGRGLVGDIMGDWRTEVVCMNREMTELRIFTTNLPTTTRLYTMAHNPAYRNHMTIKGYVQSPLPDYYLGTGLTTPAAPNIRYVGPSVQ